VRLAFVAAMIAAAAAGCGRRGALEPPPGGKAIPGEDNAQPEEQASETPGAPFGQPQRRNEPIQRPTGPFVLDPLL
jgi:predicted small lipoprotein YifL